MFIFFFFAATAIFSSSLKPNAQVALHGLINADFNGKYGKLGEFDKEKGRWAVKLTDQKSVLIKPENIRLTNIIDEIQQMPDSSVCAVSETRNAENALVRNESNEIGFVMSEKSKDGDEEYYRSVSIFWLSRELEENKDLEIRYYRSDNCYNMRTGRCGKIIVDFWRNENLRYIRQAKAEEAKAIKDLAEEKEKEKILQKNQKEASAFERHVIEVAQALSNESAESKEIKQKLLGKRFHESNYGFNDKFYTFEERNGRILLKKNDNDRGKIQYYEYRYDTIEYFDFTVTQLGDDEFELTLLQGPSTEVLRPAFPWSKDRHANVHQDLAWIGFSEHIKGETIPSGRRAPRFENAEETKLQMHQNGGKWKIKQYGEDIDEV